MSMALSERRLLDQLRQDHKQLTERLNRLTTRLDETNAELNELKLEKRNEQGRNSQSRSKRS